MILGFTRVIFANAAKPDRSAILEPTREYEAKLEAGRIIVASLKSGLRVLGETGAKATIYFIRIQGGLTLEEVPTNPDQFVNGLRNVFGIGSAVVLRNILDRLSANDAKDPAVSKEIQSFSNALAQGLRSIESGVL